MIYIGIGLAALGWFMFQAGLENDNVLFRNIGGIILLSIAVLLGLFFLSEYLNTRKKQRKRKQSLRRFKKKARKVLVNLEKVKIVTTTQTEYEPSWEEYNSEYEDLFSHRKIQRPQPIIRYYNTILVKKPIGKKKIRNIATVEMDPTKLALHFAVQKETYLYINPENEGDFYLDLEFLDE